MVLKQKVKSILIYLLRHFPFVDLPRGTVTVKVWFSKNRSLNRLENIYDSKQIAESKPVTLDSDVHKIFKDEYARITPPAFVCCIPSGKVWGVDGIVLTPDRYVLEDVSREFGKYKGKHGYEMTVFSRIHLGKPQFLKGNVAVVAAPGSSNYHHWLYDIMPKFHLLKQANVFDKIDYFLFHYTGTPFQKECLDRVGIPEEKIINANDRWKFYISVEYLWVSSFPDTLSQCNDWTIAYLRNLFLSRQVPLVKGKKLYIDRRKAKTRRVINQEELDTFLQSQNFERFFPEDHTIEETAKAFASTEIILGVHGSGFANLAFCNKEVKVIDIVAPYHVDPVYYLITSRVGGTYSYLFSEGNRPPEDSDLVIEKIDEDILLDIAKLKTLYKKILLAE